MAKNIKIYPVILAGGSGTRLWPLSREMMPKQLIKLAEEKTLIEKAIDRCGGFSKINPLIIAKDELATKIKEEVGDKKADYLVEPSARGTAAPIIYAANELKKEDKDAIMVVLTADHELDKTKFAKIIKDAALIAEEYKKIVLLGVKPNAPETGYGYIRLGDKIDGSKAYFSDSFIEKPALAKAKEYLESGKYLWNSGMFVAKVDVFLKEAKKYMPELAKIGEIEPEKFDDFYNNLENVSIDYGIMEKTSNIAVLPCDLSWSDLGSWKSVYDILPKDKNGNNVTAGNQIAIANKNSMIINGTDRLVVGIGLENIAVVDTEDATLICDINMTQEVKTAVNEIKEKGRTEHLEHKTTSRPWGRYTILDEGEGFKVKFIHVDPKAKLSLQSHKHRSEHWVVVKGQAKITKGDGEIILSQNESIYVPSGMKHRLENIGETELTIVEVQSGPYLGEDDIERYDDVYNRVATAAIKKI